MRAAAVAGVLATAFGFVVVVQRGLAGLFDLTYVFVTGVGVLALVQGLRYANEARSTPNRARETGDPEERYEVPVPGDDADEVIATTGYSRPSVKKRRQFHGRLRRVAAETLRTRGDYPDEEAVETALERGTWTDDPVAAWFLGAAVEAPPSVRVRGLLGSDVEFRFAVARTVEAVAAAREGHRTDAGDDEVRTDRETGRRAVARRLASEASRAGRRRVRAARDAIAEVRR